MIDGYRYGVAAACAVGFMLEKQGVLTVVGVGMVLGAQITPIAQSYIEQADVVFASMSHGMVEKWVMGMNGDVRNLQQYYAEGKDRTHTYAEMVNAILAEVRAGKPPRVLATCNSERVAGTVATILLEHGTPQEG